MPHWIINSSDVVYKCGAAHPPPPPPPQKKYQILAHYAVSESFAVSTGEYCIRYVQHILFNITLFSTFWLVYWTIVFAIKAFV